MPLQFESEHAKLQADLSTERQLLQRERDARLQEARLRAAEARFVPESRSISPTLSGASLSDLLGKVCVAAVTLCFCFNFDFFA